MPTELEEISKLARELPATELKPGCTYVMTYDINTVTARSIDGLRDWLREQEIRAIVIPKDGDGESIHLYRVKESDQCQLIPR